MDELVSKYKNSLKDLIDTVPDCKVESFIRILLDAYHADKQIIIAGNGGSAATANHFFCDFGKNAVLNGRRRFRILSLSTNIEAVTAIGNDISFDEVFRQQLINLMQPDDVFIAISASGNSPNIVNACMYAKEQKGHVITISGFNGGKIADIAQEAIVIPSEAYEQIEDLQMAILHTIVYVMKANQQWFE